MISLRSLIFALILCMLFISHAQANLLISPTRVVFDERARSKQIVLINSGSKTMTYRLGWEQKKALTSGGYADLTTEELSQFPVASDMLRFSPKQVSLKPGEKQIVKVAVRKPKDLENGEYRSHLLFKALPNPKRQEGTNNAMSLSLNVRMSYSMPVMIREGKETSTVDISEYSFDYSPESHRGKISVVLNKSGGKSTFGNVLAYWSNSNNGQRSMIARVNSHSIYAETQRSEVDLVWLDNPFTLSDGVLTVVYEGESEYRGQTFTTQQFNVSKENISTSALN